MKSIRFSCYLYIVFAASISSANANSNSYWLCQTQDKEHYEWTATNFYQKVAINLAYSDCKKNSKFPKSCAASKSGCDHFVDGISTSPLWRCTTYDRVAQPWKSNFYRERDDAALASQAFCKDKSTVPETCYTNTVTCENLNVGDEVNGIFGGINW
jgi:hypothetical protein